MSADLKNGTGLTRYQWHYLTCLEKEFSRDPEDRRELAIIQLIRQRLELIEEDGV